MSQKLPHEDPGSRCRLSSKPFRSDCSGATAIEYALIAGVMAIALVAGASDIGPKLAEFLNAVTEGLQT